MNKIHRNIWSTRLGALVAVAETARSHGKSAGICGSLIASVLLSTGALAQVAPGALPTGGQVSAGQATIGTSGSTMTINQSTQRAAINWQSFNVGSGAAVRFNQPGASSVTLNRVVGNEGSVINGALRANGQVWLVNPNGVLFNATARVDVGGLVASTRGMADTDFMAGRSTLQGSGQGAIVNHGQITAADGGYVALIGRAVRNDGVVIARLGTIAGAAGDLVTLNFEGNSLVGVAVSQGTLDALIDNGGAMRADGGQIVLTAKTASALLDAVVNTSGELRAQTIANRSGRILLLSDMEHGSVGVAGVLDASAPTSGNGGFIETSAAKVKVADAATVSTAAPGGHSGTWLIDPTDFIIAASGGDITGAQLSTQLANGSVVIQTVSTGSDAGDILVQDSITKSAGGNTNLTLQAHRSIVIDPDVAITATAGQLGVRLSANNGGDNTGVIEMGSGSSIATNGGSVVMGGALSGGLPANDRLVDITLQSEASINAGAGSISLFGKQVQLAEYVNLTANDIVADTAEFSTSYVSGLKLTAANRLELKASGNLQLNGTFQPAAGNAYISLESQTSLSAGNTLILNAGGDLQLYSYALKMTGTGNNTMTLSSGGNTQFYETSATFVGTPNLTLKSQQSQTQTSIADIDSDYSTVAGYLAGTSQSAYDLWRATGSDTNGSHIGLGGASYKVQVYSDGPLLTVQPKALDNGNLAIGNGLADSVNSMGNLSQPFYRDPTMNQWFKLTYSNYDMDFALGIGGVGTAGWNDSGSILSSGDGTHSLEDTISNLSINTTNLSSGTGTILIGYDLTDPDSAAVLRMTHEYSLGTGDKFIRTTTRTQNLGTSPVDNVRLWVGTRDDYVAITDSNVKTKGNVTSSGFEQIASQSDQARSIIISEFDPSTAGTPGSAVLFHSTNQDADTVTDRCCSFGNVLNKDPRTSDIVTPNQDGSYGIFMNYGSMDAGATRQVTWYYGAAPLASVGSLVNEVIAAGGTQVVPATVVTAPYTPPAAGPLVPDQALMTSRQLLWQPPAFAPMPLSAELGGGFIPVVSVPSGVQAAFGGSSNLRLSPGADSQGINMAVNMGQARQMLGGQSGDQVRVPASRNSLVQIVDGGVTLPDGVEQLLFVSRGE